MKILQLTSHYYPNLGGVETHLQDLIRELIKMKHQVFVLTYRPLSTNSPWSIWETSQFLKVFRIPWFPGLFNKLSPYPVLEFLYLAPGLFIALPLLLIISRPQVIHSHGLVAAFAGVIWGRLFGIRVIVSTHSIYHFPSSGLYRWLARVIFESADYNLCLSNQSASELIKQGVSPQKVGRFTYWVDLDKFSPKDKLLSKKALGWSGQFVVLFVGRLVSEKGIPELLKAAKKFKSGINLKIAGSGPLEDQVKKFYIGRISQDMLSLYYSAADLTIVPSTHEEGFGRVIIESLACGTPVIAANRGAIPEAMDNTVGKLIDITPKNIIDTINHFLLHQDRLTSLSKKARTFAVSNYSNNNAGQIISTYGFLTG